MLAEIGREIATAGPARNVLIFLGDLIDRGPDSAAVVERLRTIEGPFRCVFLTGNHEEILLRILDGEDDLLGDWLRFGGTQCVQSYGVDPKDLRRAPAMVAETVRNAIPRPHQQFIRSFADSFSAGDYFFVHAGIRPNISLEQQTLADLRWIRSPFLESGSRHSKMIVHGHSISKDVEFRPGRIGLDTGAYRTGLLSAIVLEEDRQRVLQIGLGGTISDLGSPVENLRNDC